jgi:ribosomal protein L12E/L44/L45/RPP1/RPP2
MENSMRLKELSEELHTNINELLSGNMSPEQTQHLVELCSELYEKLIVLRFKAFSESSTPAEKMQAVLENVEPIKIDTTPSPTPVELVNQVNLIDAIKEVEQVVAQDANALQDVTQVATQVAAQGASQEEEEEDEDEDIVFQLIPNDEPVVETPTMTVVPEAPKQEEQKAEVRPMVSLNDTFKENASQQATIAKKLEESPIADLKKNISLNQRFQFCKDLFKGNNQEYEVTLEKLNNTNRDEAMRVIQTLRDKYSWNPDSMAVKDFTDLVNRRYMA